MQAEPDLDAIERKALAALRKQLGVKARDLPKGMKRVGRRLPRDAHRAAEVISTAKAHLSHPKLGRMVDRQSVLMAETVLHGHLDKIDPKERRKDALLSMLGTQAFNLIGVALLVIGLMVWRDLL